MDLEISLLESLADIIIKHLTVWDLFLFQMNVKNKKIRHRIIANFIMWEGVVQSLATSGVGVPDEWRKDPNHVKRLFEYLTQFRIFVFNKFR